jgi:hypothetical protein
MPRSYEEINKVWVGKAGTAKSSHIASLAGNTRRLRTKPGMNDWLVPSTSYVFKPNIRNLIAKLVELAYIFFLHWGLIGTG